MLILGWDTATPATTVALLDTDTGEAIAARHDPAAGERPGHTHELLPLVERMRGGRSWARVDRLAVGTGPGSFTGLRIGLATARALALARGLPIVCVPTLTALIAAVEGEPGFGPELVLPVLDARRGEVFVDVGEGPRAVRVEDLGDTVRTLPALPVAVGDGAVRYRAELEQAGARVPEDGSPLHRVQAAWICRLAAGAPATSPGEVLPTYGRAPDARPR